ncbi:MAG: peptidoglycan-binding domain-containing protein [Patescibacteria group bacterium]
MRTTSIGLVSFLLLAILLIAPFAFAENDDRKERKDHRNNDKKAFMASRPFSNTGTTTSAMQEQIKSLRAGLENLKTQRGALGNHDNGRRATTTKAMRDTLKAEIKEKKKEIRHAKKELRFARSLARGMSGDDVRNLQELLAQDSSISSAGLVTGFFGHKTEEALRKFQKKFGIEANGVLGPKTQAKILALFVGRELPPGIIKRLGLETSTTTPGKGFVTVCHKPTGTAQQSLVIAIPALGAHLGHGDMLGVCPRSGTATTTPPTATTTPSVSTTTTATVN